MTPSDVESREDFIIFIRDKKALTVEGQNRWLYTSKRIIQDSSRNSSDVLDTLIAARVNLFSRYHTCDPDDAAKLMFLYGDQV